MPLKPISFRHAIEADFSYPGEIIEMINHMKLFVIITVRLVTAPQSYGGKHEKSAEKASLQQA